MPRIDGWLVLLATSLGIGPSTAAVSVAPGMTQGTGRRSDWVKYEDPLEHAFTVEVPAGWTVRGGMYRLGYSDHRSMVDATSPDGSVNIRFGDVALPTYFLPTPYHKEGEVADLGAQAQGTYARYRTGAEFVVLYAGSRFKSQCQTHTQRPNDQPLPAMPTMPDARNGGPMQATQGQATYACAAAGHGSRTAFAYALTALYPNLWQARVILSVLAPSKQMAQVRSIVEHLTGTMQLSPEWVARQNQMDQDALVYQEQRQQQRRRMLSQQVAQFEVRMQGMQSQVAAFEAGQARQAAQVASVGNTLTGVTPTTDPLGNPHTVFTGPKSGYWINGRGETMNSDASPGAGWQRLEP